jgi:hypothetical protein
MYSHVSSKVNYTSISFALLMGIAFLSLWSVEGYAAATPPALPQTYIDTTYSAPTGATCTATNSSAFQTCLNNAPLNSTIVLQAGTTYTGPFTLPNKISGSGWIYIVSSNLANLPPPGTRVTPSDSSNMPKVVINSSQGTAAILTTGKAHHYRFVGIEFKPATGSPFVYYIVDIGTHNPTTVEGVATDITFDRCYFHGDTTLGTRRALRLDAISGSVIDSHITDIQAEGADNQAIWVNNTPGPIKIYNNFLQADTENVNFGGSGIPITNCVPADIEIRRNHFYKPLSWQPTKKWFVKNLLEFKNAQRVLIEGNIFENNWADAQNGFSLLITPRNQYGNTGWTRTRDITIRLNKFINLGSGISISAIDDEAGPSQVTERILIQNNVFVINGAFADGRAAQLLGNKSYTGYPTDVVWDHNTIIAVKDSYHLAYPFGTSMNNFEYKNNLVFKGSYGFYGQNKGDGLGTLETFFPSYVFTKNAIIGGTSSAYPATNYFPSSITNIGFIDYAGGNYRLAPYSPYKNAGTDGKDLGADIDAIEAAIADIGMLQAPKNLRLVQ